MTDKLKDSDGDGIPDVIEDALDEAKAIKKRFGTKMILTVIVVALVVASWVITGFMYSNLKDDYIVLEAQHKKAAIEHEIEKKQIAIDAREKVLADLVKAGNAAVKNKTKKKAARMETEHELVAKPYARRNEHEATKMDNNDLRNAFNDLGFPTKPSASE